MHYFKEGSKKVVNAITANNTRQYLIGSLVLAVMAGVTTTTLLWKFSNIKTLYINILIGVCVLVASVIIGGAIGYAQDKKALLKTSRGENSSSPLPEIIRNISQAVLDTKCDALGQGPIRDKEQLLYTDVKKEIDNHISTDSNYQKLERAEKSHLKGIIFGQVYLDWKYPNGIADQQTNIEISGVDFGKQMALNVAVAALISIGMDHITQNNWDTTDIQKINFTNSLSKYFILGRMDQYRKIKAKFPEQGTVPTMLDAASTGSPTPSVGVTQ